MPSSFTNTTNVSSSGSTTPSPSHPATNRTNSSTTNAYDPASDLGYGVGRLLRGAFDIAWNVYQSWWNPTPSQTEIALQKQHKIYRQGLEECVKHLERAIDNLRKNPNDPQSLKRIEKLTSHYAAYVQPAPTDALKQVQQKLFQSIEEKIRKLHSYDLKRTLTNMLPIFSLGKEVLIDTKEESEELNYHPPTTVPMNKRSVMQQPFPAVFNLSTLGGSNGFMVPGVASSAMGSSVSSAGDINGDKITDLVLGAPGTNALSGVSYVIFGQNAFSTPAPTLTVVLDILSNGTIILESGQLPITDQSVILVESIQNGYLTIVDNPLIPIQNFTYYQLQNRQIQLVRNGTGPLNLTLSFNDGLGQTVLISPLVNFFNTNNPDNPSVPLAAVVGSVVGTTIFAAAVGLIAFGIFKRRREQEREEKRGNAAPELSAVANPLQRAPTSS